MRERLWPKVATNFPLTLEKQLEPGRYASWWRTSPGESAASHPTIVAIGDTLTACGTHFTYMIADFLAPLRACSPESLRVKTPARGEELMWGVRLPSGAQALLSVSHAEGFLWKFRMDGPVAERDALWALTAKWAKGLSGLLTLTGNPEDGPEFTECRWWWSMQRAIIDGKLPESGPVEAVAMYTA